MLSSWRMGFPGWQIAARFGIAISIKIDIYRDAEACVYYATSDDIGLALESESLDSLINEIHAAVPVLLEISNVFISSPKADIHLHDDFVAA